MGERVLGSTQDRRRSTLGEGSAAVPPPSTYIQATSIDIFKLGVSVHFLLFSFGTREYLKNVFL